MLRIKCLKPGDIISSMKFGVSVIEDPVLKELVLFLWPAEDLKNNNKLLTFLGNIKYRKRAHAYFRRKNYRPKPKPYYSVLYDNKIVYIPIAILKRFSRIKITKHLDRTSKP
jgi:hypothetical protein